MTKLTETTLKKLRTNLLDLTFRNRLLNFKYSNKSVVRVIDEIPAILFKKLLDDKTLTFKSIPQPPMNKFIIQEVPESQEDDGTAKKPIKTRPPVAEYAKSLGINTQYELSPKPSKGVAIHHGDNEVQTLFYPDELEGVIGKIYGGYKTAIEETGNNLLFLTFGCLEYYESDQSTDPKFGPLILLPVELKRVEPTGDNPYFTYTVKATGEEPTVNESLLEKLKKDFAIILPNTITEPSDEEGEEEVLLDKYIDKLRTLLNSSKPEWKVKQEVNLTLLNFGKLVLYKDLLPDNWASCPTSIENHPIINVLCNGQVKDQESNSIFAPDYEIDDLPIEQINNLIYDADSSQHSALVDVIKGKNLVIEGPPGTGKSQTITNMIASCMLSGKSVLFVAEKLAALEVVKKRLDEAGLGDFCLELHSTKVQKAQVIQSFKKRMDGKYKRPSELEATKQALNARKEDMQNYVQTLCQPSTLAPKTYFECISRFSEIRTELNSLKLMTDEIENMVVTVSSISNEVTLKRELDKVKHYFYSIERIIADHGSLSSHPWNIIQENPSPDLNQILKETESFKRNLEVAQKLLGDMNQDMPKSLVPSIELLKCIYAYIKLKNTVLFKPSYYELVQTFARPVSELKKAHTILEQLISDAKVLSQLQAEGLVTSPAFNSNNFQELKRLSTGLNFHKSSNQLQLQKALGEICSLLEMLQEIETHFAVIRQQLCIERPTTFKLIQNYSETIHELKKLSDDERTYTVACNAFLNQSKYKSFKTKLESLNNLHKTCDNALNFPRPESAHYVSTNIETLKTTNWFNSLFSKERKAAKKWLATITRNRVTSITTVQNDLFEYLKLCQQTEQTRSDFNDFIINQDIHLQNYSEVDNLVTSFGTTVAKLQAMGLKHDTAKEVVTERFKELYDYIDGPAHIINEFYKQKEVIFENFSYLTALSKPLSEAIKDIQKLAETITSVLANPIVQELPESLSMMEIEQACDIASRINTNKQHLTNFFNSSNITDSMGHDELSALVKNIITYVEEVHTAGSVFGSFACSQFFITIDRSNNEFLSLLENLVRSTEQICTLNSKSLEKLNIYDADEKIEAALINKQSLNDWTNYLSNQNKLKESPFFEMSQRIKKFTGEADVAVKLSEYLFLKDVVLKQIKKSDILNFFEGHKHDRIRDEFASLDAKLISLHRAHVAYALSTKAIPDGLRQGPRKTWTENSLLENEVSKQRAHIPIRQLMLRAFKAIQQYKPCFMMSPISVAQFLPPQKAKFDVVIMDEASQLKPEDAMGSIARGGQLVVVGDTKQLPPTDFFKSSDNGNNDFDEDELKPDEFESILEQASGVFSPSRRLKWHYRSRHESLIAFSNCEFYDNDLILFPTAIASSDELGIKHHFVEDGTYEGNTNVREAKAILEQLKLHARKHPSESVGIVAMNAAQKDLIEELIMNESKLDPFLLKFIGDEGKKGRESYFVKNLENVQGDERDVIYVSITYGKDVNGNFYHRFGPLNNKNGYRRLNVLFSRSKKRMHIFSSFNSSLLAGAASVGAQALQKFLHFSETGILKKNESVTGKAPDSPFETSVIRAIKNLGYEAVPQIGVAGYFVDIGIQDPNNNSTYMLGVECDGATYHSSKSARDRDRLRQQNLENLGWKIHRIWSTDWFKNEKREIQRLKVRIESILNGKDSSTKGSIEIEVKPRPSFPTQDREQLRKDLIELREKTIKIKCPQVRPEEGILRKSLLELFVEFLPKTEIELRELCKLKQQSFAEEHSQFIPLILKAMNKQDVKAV